MVDSVEGNDNIERGISEREFVGAQAAVVDMGRGKFTIYMLSAFREHSAAIIRAKKPQPSCQFFRNDLCVSACSTPDVDNIKWTVTPG
jgi:hypothetical protein